MPEKVLVIGAGLGGTSAIVGLRKLNKEVEITLVEPKEYSECVWAAFRSPFEEWVAKGSVYDLKPFCEKNKVKHVRSLVTSLSKTSATLENGDTVSFDSCVVATGASTAWEGLGRGPHHWSVQDRLDLNKREGAKLLNAGSVLVVGGGLIGVEVAGDLMSYAKKAGKPLKVTLVHSQDHLCPEMSEPAAAKVKSFLEKLGVKVVLGERAVKGDDGKYTLQTSGEALEANEVVMTIGLSPVNEFFKSGGLESSLTDTGFVETDEFFRVKGTDGRIFAIGDCCTTLPNSGSQILTNIKIVGFNVNSTLKAPKGGAPDASKLKKFTLGPEVYLATTGTKRGVMYSPGFWTTRMFPWLKQKTMFLFRIKSELGLKPFAAVKK